MGAEVSGISLGALSNGAHYNYMQATVERAEADTAIMAKLSAEVADLKAKLRTENDNMVISRKSSYTDLISEEDTNRDTAYRGYRANVKNAQNLSDAEVKAAAKTLMQHMTDYAINPRAQLDKETGLLTNFIEDLEGTYAEEVALTGSAAFVADMRAANDKVRAYLIERDTENSSRVLSALRAARLETDAAYRSLVKKTNAYALVEGDADYVSFINGMNAQITRYKQEVLGQSASYSASGTDDDGTDTGDDDDDNTGEVM